MDYRKIYDNLIERSRDRDLTIYTEKHHIIPRCLGGTDAQENIVKLTPEEHYVAHQLLVKIHIGNHRLVRAAQMMIPNRPSNKLYGWLRRKFVEGQKISQSGENNSQYGTIWINKDNVPKRISKEELNRFLVDGYVIGRTIKVKKIKIKVKKVKIIPITDILRLKHHRIRNSISYRKSLATKLYNEFVSTGLSLRKFANEKNVVPMSLSKLFRKFIMEYREREHYNINKNCSN